MTEANEETVMASNYVRTSFFTCVGDPNYSARLNIQTANFGNRTSTLASNLKNGHYAKLR